MTRLAATFVASAFALDECPRWSRVEVALAGRSNVGKSSLLNALAGHKGLARTSRTPGRTRCLNFFAVGQALALADLPGYGYAKTSRDEAQRIGSMMREYLERRRNLAALVLLVDARRGPEEEEHALVRLARARGLELVVAATKCDKLARSQRAPALGRFAPLAAQPIVCSAQTREGIDELRRRIAALDRAEDRRPGAPR